MTVSGTWRYDYRSEQVILSRESRFINIIFSWALLVGEKSNIEFQIFATVLRLGTYMERRV